ncbi:hypothetical protein AVEN_103514-1 [Araneus ventricosus]|uniref:Mariner Mos1 transposase n=1 Tax=Araneus ventricosus TaxID=182803 RepID=A0A4Y2WP53_ARAVE|nr:hypothetical protein AVEN_103514-1 [Araneus ventricosus]
MHHELLKSSKTVDNARYQQQIDSLSQILIVKPPQWDNQYEMRIFLYVNSSPYTSKLVLVLASMLKELACEVFLHPLYSLHLAHSDFRLFRSMAQTLFQKHFITYDDVVRWISDNFASKKSKVILEQYPHFT